MFEGFLVVFETLSTKPNKLNRLSLPIIIKLSSIRREKEIFDLFLDPADREEGGGGGVPSLLSRSKPSLSLCCLEFGPLDDHSDAALDEGRGETGERNLCVDSSVWIVFPLNFLPANFPPPRRCYANEAANDRGGERDDAAENISNIILRNRTKKRIGKSTSRRTCTSFDLSTLFYLTLFFFTIFKKLHSLISRRSNEQGIPFPKLSVSRMSNYESSITILVREEKLD